MQKTNLKEGLEKVRPRMPGNLHTNLFNSSQDNHLVVLLKNVVFSSESFDF